MQQRNYNYLLYFISLVIVVTLAIQAYWNYKNYQAGKQQLIGEVQASLDNAVDSYYIDLADKNTVAYDLKKGDSFTNNSELDSLLRKIDVYSSEGKGIDSLDLFNISKVNVIPGKNQNLRDSLVKKNARFTTTTRNFSQGEVLRMREAGDSVKNLFELTSRVIIAITTDTLNVRELNNYIYEQLRAKDLEVDFGFIFENTSGKIQRFNEDIKGEASLSTVAKSAYLPKDSNFELFFTNETATILKRNLLGMILSALLIASVVACLFFLLRIIQKQKQLAELKNDLISNITHEFKTPISTVKVALEGIENFNHENDPDKTKRYLQLSHLQLNKLQTMVEKLLETATLDGDKLQLEKEAVHVVELVRELVEKHKNLSPNKTFHFTPKLENVVIVGDPFHLENALNNVLDNAVKYGGDTIDVEIFAEEQRLKIKIRDDGNSLTPSQSEQIFEKFYRVPSGNIHNIKGFGIGLYYTRQIIEKHGGVVKAITNGTTVFEISLPNE